MNGFPFFSAVDEAARFANRKRMRGARLRVLTLAVGFAVWAGVAAAQLPTPEPTPTPEPLPTAEPTPTPPPDPLPTAEPTPTPEPLPTPGPTPTPIPDQPGDDDDPGADCFEIIYDEDFEAGLGGWEIDNAFAEAEGFGAGLWRLANDCAADLPDHSQPQALGYASGVCAFDQEFMHAGQVVSPIIDLRDGDPATERDIELTFRYFLDADDEDVTVTVTILDLTNLVEVTIGSSPAMAGTQALANPSQNWTLFTADLSAFADSRIQIVVTLFDGDEEVTPGQGFFIDDFLICGDEPVEVIDGDPDDPDPVEPPLPGAPLPNAARGWQAYE